MAIVEAVKAEGGARRRLQVRSPVTEEVIGEFEVQNALDVKAAVQRAREAQRSWGAKSVGQRAKYIQRALQVLIERQDEYIAIIRRETGRSVLETYFMEIFACADSMNFFSRNAKKMLADKKVGMHLLKMKKARIVYKPLGVVGIITPWNGPFVLSLNPTVQALMAGNAVIIKPSEVTPFSGQLVEKLFREAGLPENLVQVMLGDGETGAALCNSGVDKIGFTGSVETGRKVGEACGRNLIPCTLELGGKDPMIVCRDANLERAAGGAVFGAFMNTGQFCCSTERVYVVEPVYDAFVAKVVEKVGALKQGSEGEYDVGAFIFDKQIEKVESQVEDAVKKGAKVLVGGKRNESLGRYFYEPTVLTEVTHEMSVMTDETFGPVLPIMKVRDEEEAVRLANDTRYGLSGSVWTKDKKRGEQLARRVETGSCMVNESSLTYGALEVPFGGVKASGVGYVNGEAGLLGYCQAVPIITDRFGQKTEQVWYPYTDDKLEGMRKAVKVLWGTPLKYLMK